MVQQITNGIHISVKTVFNGTTHRNEQLYYMFSYFVSIKNTTKDTVQLLECFWNIYDSLNDSEFVEGEGVVAQTPILTSNDIYNYKSHCFLNSNSGAMKGFYKMKNTETSDEFMVAIPTFQFSTKPQQN
jgi:ApaG protein